MSWYQQSREVSSLARFYDNGAKLEIPSDITPPLKQLKQQQYMNGQIVPLYMEFSMYLIQPSKS